MNGPTHVLASFLSGLTYADLPPEAVEKAKFVFLDTLGAAVAGSQAEEGSIAARLARKLSGKEESVLIASDMRVDCLYAALFNGIMAHALELDDGNRYAMGHPGVAVIPAVLALGETEKKPGKAIIAAIVAGYEAFGRIAAAGNPSHYHRGFHTTGTCGTFGAAAACGNLFGFDTSQMVQNLGIAGSQSAGLFAFMSNGAMTKVLHPGKAAQSGILSALLIREGFTGPDTVLEHKQGFYAGYADRFRPERITEGLGEKFEIMNTYTKYHAACRHIHPSADAALVIRKEYRIEPEEIESIRVRTYEVAAKLTGGKEITTPLSGKMSLPYCIAAAFAEGEVGLGQFSPQKLADSGILSLMEKVEVISDSGFDKLIPDHRCARVEVVTKSGRTCAHEVLDALGEPENPGTMEDQLRKFKGCTNGVFEPNRMDRLIDCIRHLEEVEDLTDVAELLRK
jgi:2-methylcitrate dehydratase PrpD